MLCSDPCPLAPPLLHWKAEAVSSFQGGDGHVAEKDAAAEKENAEPTAEKPQVIVEPKKPILMIAVAAVNMVVMAAVVFMLVKSHNAELTKPKLSDVVEGVAKEDTDRAGKEDALIIGKLIPMETFTVNLAGTRGSKYARINMELEVDGPKVEEEIDKRKPQIRDIIIILLSSKTYDSVTTKEGKLFLRNEIKDTLNSFLTKGKVKQVYFTDFVVN